jgi:glycosyltransferase involved in cell wall biosynthesis
MLTADITPLRIAIVNEWYEAGATRCAKDLYREFSRRHSVLYLPRHDHETWATVKKALAEFRPDIVHLHSYYGNLPYSVLARVSWRYPTCFTVHDPRPIGHYYLDCWECSRNRFCLPCPARGGPLPKPAALAYLFALRSWKRLMNRLTSRSLRVVSPSDWLRHRLAEREMARFELHTIPYGIDLDHFRPRPEARKQLNLPPDVPLLLHVAYSPPGWVLNERKGLRPLATAFVEQVVPRFPNALLLVVGDGLVPNHTNIRPAGFVSQADMPTYYSAVDAFVTYTRGDNLPYAVMEAMGCGCAVVGAQVGGVPELIEDGVTGLLVPRDDTTALGQALVRILEDRERTGEFGRAGRRRAERLYGMEPFVGAYERLFRSMLGSRSPSP